MDWKTIAKPWLTPEQQDAIDAIEHDSLRATLARARHIWGDQKLDTAGVLARLMVDVGKLARYVRGATKDTRDCDQCGGTGKFERRHAVTNDWLGDLCELCNGTGRLPKLDLRLILGNMIFSLVRWCDDLGLDPAECVRMAEEQQRRFAAENPER